MKIWRAMVGKTGGQEVWRYNMEEKIVMETDFSRLLRTQALAHPSMQPQDVVKLCFQAAFGAEHLLSDMDAARNAFYEEFEATETGAEETETTAADIEETETTAVDIEETETTEANEEETETTEANEEETETTEADVKKTETAAAGTEVTGAAKKDEEALYEIISPGFCRVNLRAWKRRGLPGEWLFRMFALTAGADAEPVNEDAAGAGMAQEAFWEFFKTAQSLVVSGFLPFSEQEWTAFRISYEAAGVRPLHHSGKYRQGERPAYRIIKRCFLRLLPVLLRMNGPAADREVFVVAVDGRSASGKTTLAAELEAVTGAGIVHMDDFFLPPELRTSERFSQPGGNVHYERFREEVLPGLSHREAFSYTRFDCGKMEMGELRQVADSRWRIVEGAYSLHPALGKYMDLSVFCDVEPKEQLRRIRIRNGEEAAAVFSGTWIPLEEAYFQAYDLETSADLVI